jgi:hypothetical protein
MAFETVLEQTITLLEQTITLLQHQRRISYGALKRRFQ